MSNGFTRSYPLLRLYQLTRALFRSKADNTYRRAVAERGVSTQQAGLPVFVTEFGTCDAGGTVADVGFIVSGAAPAG